MATANNITSQLKSLRGQIVESICVRIFPPKGESFIEDVDASFGFVMTDGEGKALFIFTSHDDGWSPAAALQDMPVLRKWNELESRLKAWMEDIPIGDVNYEFYSVEGGPIADSCRHQIEDVQMMLIDGEGEPFGVRFRIGGAWFLSYSSANGNSIEAPGLKLGRGVAAFESLGRIVYR